VLVTDPKYNFVILDVGENQGVLEYGEFLVNRNGKLVAKVVVRTVQKDRSIANVLPGWALGEILEGDQIIPAHPAS
jgi:cell shape-determining protein MreC